ncbi:MAG: OmpA family protein [Bacteroidia bacterium]
MLKLVGLGLLLVYAQSVSFISPRRLERWYELSFYERITGLYERQPERFSAEGLLWVARAYQALHQGPKAYTLYTQLSQSHSVLWDTLDLWYYATLLHARGETAKALNYYRLYQERGGQNSALQTRLTQLEACTKLNRSSAYSVEVVSELEQWAPVYAAWWDGERLYAVSRAPSTGASVDREGQPYERIIPPLPLRFPYHQAVVGELPPDTLLIYLADRKGRIFTFPKNASPNARLRVWRRLPQRPSGRISLAIDPKTRDVYIAHDPGLGKPGGRDLYRFVHLGDGRYGPAQRLPPPINTPYDEDAPFIVEDTLYFASNNPRSVGGYDIFYCLRVGEREWGPPQSLPAPINSCANDIYYYPFSPEHTYFSSDRDGVMKVYRSHRVTPPPLPPPPPPPPPPSPPPITHRFTIQGRILHKDTRVPLAGEVILVDSLSQKEIFGVKCNENGEFLMFPPDKGGVFYLYAQMAGFITHVQVLRFSPQDSTTWRQQLEIPLMPIEMEATFALRNIYFDFNSDRLRPESIPELERLRRLLLENPHIRIRFSGHTDNIGSDKYNQKLSERRARAVYQWLRQHGIHPVQMEYIGYGKTRPIASNATEEGRALNRRIEMEVVGIRRTHPSVGVIQE